ncbi:MAG: hypothetical protein RBU37_09265 [Myxococcota bacterium]|jgi:hypothetical protein|nr:hypothetical protein [Myxococcota bacterium]
MKELFERSESFVGTKTYDAETLAEAGIEGELALLLEELGSGELKTPGGLLFHVLDPDGIVYWSREVLEKLQGTAQPAGLQAFFIDEGGGSYAFRCSNGVYTLHHQKGLLARYDSIAAFFLRAFEKLDSGRNPFDVAGSDQSALEVALREALPLQETPLQERLAGTKDAEFRSYDPYSRWREGELMRHPVYGKGIVTAVKTTTLVQVAFATGKRTVAHRGW